MISTLQSKDFRWIKDPELGGGHYVDKVLGLDRIRFMRSPLRECSPRHLRPTIEDFVGVLDRQLPDFEVQLGPGDILAFDNTRLLHRRGHTVDPQRERLLLHAKVMQRNP